MEHLGSRGTRATFGFRDRTLRLERSLPRCPWCPPSSFITAPRHRNVRPPMKAVGSAPGHSLRRARCRRRLQGRGRRGEPWHSRARPWAVRQPAPTGGLLSHEAGQHRKPRTPVSLSALGFWLGASTNGRALMPGVEEPVKRGLFASLKKAATIGHANGSRDKCRFWTRMVSTQLSVSDQRLRKLGSG